MWLLAPPARAAHRNHVGLVVVTLLVALAEALAAGIAGFDGHACFLATVAGADAVGAVVPLAIGTVEIGEHDGLEVPVEGVAARAAPHLHVGHRALVVDRLVAPRMKVSAAAHRAEVLRSLGLGQALHPQPLHAAAATTRFGRQQVVAWRGILVLLGFRLRVTGEPGGVLEPGLAAMVVLEDTQALELTGALARATRRRVSPRPLGFGRTS